MAITIFTDVFQEMDDAIINILGNQTAQVMNVISPIIIACFGLYLLLIAMSYIKGGAEPIDLGVDLIYRFIAWAVILGFSMNMGNYTSYVVTIVHELPTELANVISGSSSGTSTTNGLDGLLDLYYNAMADMYEDIDFFDVGGMLFATFIAVILFVCGVPFVIASGAFILLSKIMSAILLVLGPIFIVLALFPATRQYFSLWVGQIVNYILLLVILQILGTIQIEFLTTLMGSEDLDLFTSISVGAVSLLFFVVVLRVPDLTSALSNGLAITGFGSAYRSLSNTGKTTSAVSKGAGKVMGGAKGIANKAMGRGSANKIKPENKGV